MKRLLCLLLALCMVLSLTACGGEQPESIQLFAMDTVMDLTAYGENAAAALTDASREINRLERLLSRTIDTSEISQINAGGAVTVSEETASLLAQAQTYTAATDGAFDVTIAPLVSLWGITTDSPYVPTQQEIDALLPLVGSEHLHLSGDTATLDDGCAIDLGGIAKGYASDRVAAIFARHGITSGTISLGGNVYVCGSKPNGQPWVVAIQNPRSDGYAVTVALMDSFAVTSGGYQRYYTAPDGTVYQHILDPKTGYPVESDLLSVSILCDNGTMADAYSTALYVMGSAGAQAFWRTHGGFEMILITTAGQVLYTPGLSEKSLPRRAAAMNTYPSTPKLRPTLWDGVVAALVAALAIVTILCFYGRRTGAPQAVTITHRGALIQTIRLTGLTETKTVAIDGDYHLEIQVDSGGVCVTRSDCPGQDCVHTGRITRSGQSIVCLPEQVVIQLTGGTSDADVVLG